MPTDKIKLNKFVLYVSSIAIALFVFAYSVGEVKAEVVLTPLTESGGTYTIPSYSDSAMFICGGGGWSNSFTLDSATSTNMLSFYNGSNWILNYDYVLNPSVGSLSYTGTDSFTRCFLVSGLDSTTPYTIEEELTFEYVQDPKNIIVSGSYSDDFYLMGGFTAGNAYVYDPVISSSTVEFYGVRAGTTVFPYVYKTEASGLENTSYFVDWSGTGSTSWKLWVVNFNEPSIPSNDYILYYGDDPYYQEINEPIYLPFVYDICDTWSASSTYSVRLVDSLDNDIQENNKILTSCSGSNFVYPFSYDEDFSDDVRIIIFDEEDNIIVESEEFLFNIYTPVLSDSDFILYTLDNPLYINTDLGTGTEPISFSYNVCSDSDFASSTFILKNISENIETEYTFTPSTCSGNTYINVPYNQYMNYTFPAKIIYKSGGDVLLDSMPFQLVFYSNQLTDLSDLDEETATSTNIVVNFATTQLNKLKNIFPFNFPVAIITAWNNSKVEPLDSSLDFLDMSNSDGSLTATFPKEWALTESDIEFDFFSEDMITQGSTKAQEFFANFKLFTKWLQYFLFAWAMIYFSKKIINDLTENKSDDI